MNETFEKSVVSENVDNGLTKVRYITLWSDLRQTMPTVGGLSKIEY